MPVPADGSVPGVRSGAASMELPTVAGGSVPRSPEVGPHAARATAMAMANAETTAGEPERFTVWAPELRM